MTIGWHQFPFTALYCTNSAKALPSYRQITGNFCNSNVVGYETQTSADKDKFVALSVVFENVSDSEGKIAIGDLLKVASPLGTNAYTDNADQIWLWDGSNWVIYYFRTNKAGTTIYGWCKSDSQTPTTDTISNGETFFFRRSSKGDPCDLTLSGQVRAFTKEKTYTGLVGDTFKFVGYPWPVSMPIDGFQKYIGAPKGTNAYSDNADQIWRWNGSDWVIYYFRTNKAGTTIYGWCKSDTQTPTTDVISMGEGFFFRTGSGKLNETLTFTYGD